MVTAPQSNYQRIADAIHYINANFRQQPNLEEVATAVGLSPFHFQRVFTEWAGVSPKKFLQYISVEHAKNLLRQKQVTLFDTADQVGLSSTGRLHDLFITIEGMSPGDYKKGGEFMRIHYRFSESFFGKLIVASTSKGICYLAFIENEVEALSDLYQHFPLANFKNADDRHQQNAIDFLLHTQQSTEQIKLHLRGSEFQLKVWNALLKIPTGQLRTYGNPAEHLDNPKASRAVGTAIGSNPVAYLIPCHRVIQSTGLFGGYMWGPVRKQAIIGWEISKTVGSGQEQ